MYFLTARRREQKEENRQSVDSAYSVRSAVFSYLRKKDRLQVVLACVGGRNTIEHIDDSWRQNHVKWCKDGDAQAVLGRVQKGLLKLTDMPQSKRTGGEDDCAILCCAGNLCVYGWRGNADIRLLNTSFGKSSVRTLTRAAEQMTWEWAGTEPQVGILLGSRAFFDAVGNRDLTEALAIGSLCSQLQTERHLAELPEAPAALVVTKEGLFLGSGAFGCVYRTEYDGHTVACKEARTTEGIELLQREAGLLREIHHSVFPAYFDFRMENGTARLFMEEVEGETLHEILLNGKTFPEREVRRLAAELADGLLYLHRMPGTVLYRDLKPENLILSHRGLHSHVRIVDLGCACKAAVSGSSRAGSPGFAAPEQLADSSNPQSPACDVYAFGILLGCMTGLADVQSGKRAAVQQKRVCSPELAGIIAACLRKDPARRPSMETLLEFFCKNR